MMYKNKDKVIEILKLIINQIEVNNTDYCAFHFSERDDDPTKYFISCELEINNLEKENSLHSKYKITKKLNGSNRISI